MDEKEAVREVIVILKRRLRKKLPRECWEKILEEIDEIETVLEEHTYEDARRKWGL
ncbi:MAG: hypothetical protein QXP97_07645 [Desulfurococcus sp.]|uniref:hypothetical protein n=1 Tax=Desulfurococcus sp. TaxID=51678 RepID=UPI0031680F10